jgi:uncharacterized membrane protein YebE (DUF533 family)
MKHREATPRHIKDFERIAAEPKTAEVMESLSRQLCTNFERPSRVFLEIAANKLGLPKDLMDAFHEWFRFNRVAQPATCGFTHKVKLIQHKVKLDTP